MIRRGKIGKKTRDAPKRTYVRTSNSLDGTLDGGLTYPTLTPQLLGSVDAEVDSGMENEFCAAELRT